MKATIKKEIEITSEEIAKGCYDNFVELMTVNIQDFLIDAYGMDFESACNAACDIPKNEFVEILSDFITEVMNDKYFACGYCN